jgi:HCOMODA/2-hydroxy-3-carboxy-muconic semialdehyde decarboxylase
MGPVMGQVVPLWDSRDEFGDTDLMVVKPEEGRSLARALGPNWMVLMARHGATVAGRTLRELVFRTVYSHANAEIQLRAMAIGKIAPLNEAERQRAEPRQLQPRPMARAWEYWTTRLQKAGGLPPQSKSRAAKRPTKRASKARAKRSRR